MSRLGCATCKHVRANQGAPCGNCDVNYSEFEPRDDAPKVAPVAPKVAPVGDRDVEMVERVEARLAARKACSSCATGYDGGATHCADCDEPDLKHWRPIAATRSANPKDALGAAKVSLTKLPAVACLHAAAAMGDGARKYGAFNWRSKPVIASIYVDACLRHINAWHDREENASDSGVHHLGHAMACLAIILDAQECGALVDDRPEGAGGFVRVLAALNERGAARASAAKPAPVASVTPAPPAHDPSWYATGNGD